MSNDDNKFDGIPKVNRDKVGGPKADDASRRELSVDSNAQKIGLKKPQGNDAGAGIRSPLINNSQRQSEPVKPKKKEGSDLAHSAIEGLSRKPQDFSSISKISFVHPSHAGVSDNYRRRRSLIAAAVLVVICMVTTGIYFTSSEFRDVVHEGIVYVKKEFTTNEKRNRSRERRKKRHQERKRYRQKMAAKSAIVLEGAACKSVINSGYMYNEYKKMNLKDRLKLAECQMIYGDYRSAQRALQKENQIIEKTKDKLLTSSDEGRAYYMLLASQVKVGMFKEAEGVSGQVCRIWKQSHACYGRVLATAFRGHGNSGLRALNRINSKKKKKLGGFAEAWLSLSAGMLYDKSSRPQTAERNYKKALSYAKVSDTYLRKEIYESYAVSLYQRGELLKLKKIVNKALGELRAMEHAPKLKLILLKELSNPRTAKKFLSKFLSHAELAVHIRGDTELIDIISPEVMRYNLHKHYQRLLAKTKKFLLSKHQGSRREVEKISMWEIRSIFATGTPQEVISLLAKYNSKYGASLESSHLLGAAYLKDPSGGRAWAIKAARSFQRSLKKDRNWEGMYGLGIALIQNDQQKKSIRVIKDLERMVESHGQVYWLEMLKVEWYITTKRYKQADALISKWIRKEPSYLKPLKLKIKRYKIQGNYEEMRMAELQLDKAKRKVHFASSREGMSSPLGPMSLRKRPLE